MNEIVARADELTAVALPAHRQPAPAASTDDPRFEIRAGLLIAALFFLLFLGWAAFARLDAAAAAPGRLVVTGQRASQRQHV